MKACEELRERDRQSVTLVRDVYGLLGRVYKDKFTALPGAAQLGRGRERKTREKERERERERGERERKKYEKAREMDKRRRGKERKM